jgi:hypothetical protein
MLRGVLQQQQTSQGAGGQSWRASRAGNKALGQDAPLLLPLPLLPLPLLLPLLLPLPLPLSLLLLLLCHSCL